MLSETKVYSDFIKRNNIIVTRDYFIIGNEQIDIWRDKGKWYTDMVDLTYTKKAAIYYHIHNCYIIENGIIGNKLD